MISEEPHNDDEYNVDINITLHQLGFPGETLDTLLMEAGSDAAFPSRGKHGKYRVEMILARPNQLPERTLFNPYALPFDGNSYIRLAKKKSDRRLKDLHQLNLDSPIGRIRLLPNDEGFAGKFVSEEFLAENFIDAEAKFNDIIMPLVSGFSMYLDTPIHVEITRIKEIASSQTFSRSYVEFWPAWLGPAGTAPRCHPEFVHYAAVYREALSSSSPSYRFLCFYKILESIGFRRARLAKAAKDNGEDVSRHPNERVPKAADRFPEFLRLIYPYAWLRSWDPVSVQQIFLAEALGKSIQNLSDSYLRPIRDRISHALMEDGELGVNINNTQQVQLISRWLPLLRCLTRLRLRNEFPDQFVFEAKI